MTGEALKVKLLNLEKSLASVARKLGMTPQALNQALAAADIKTGFIETLSVAYNRPVSYFFGEFGSINIDDHSAQSIIGNSTVEDYRNNDTALVEKIKVLESKIKSLESKLEDKEQIIALYKKLESK